MCQPRPSSSGGMFGGKVKIGRPLNNPIEETSIDEADHQLGRSSAACVLRELVGADEATTEHS